MIHIALLKRNYLDMLLDGRKTMESRLSITRRAPFRAVMSGESIFFKQSGGPYRAHAIINQVEFIDGLTPRAVRALRTRVNGQVLGESAYWRSKRTAKYATLLTFREIMPCDTGPALPVLAGRAWVCMPDDAGAMHTSRAAA